MNLDQSLVLIRRVIELLKDESLTANSLELELTITKLREAEDSRQRDLVHNVKTEARKLLYRGH